MKAALHAADETVTLLLSKGADPNVTDSFGFTALIASIISGCTTTASLLAPVTTVAIEKTLRCLADCHMELTPPIADLVSRAAETHVKQECPCGFFFSRECSAVRGLDYATTLGHSQMVEILTRGWPKGCLDPDGDPGVANFLLMEAVMSDNAATVSAILKLTPSVWEENIILASERGRADVVKLFFSSDQEEETAAKLELREKIMNRSADIDLRLPKSVEFRYENELEKLRPLLSKTTVAYSDLLEVLHVPPIHADKKCPVDCTQKEECDRMRQVFDLVCSVVAKIGEINPVFRLGDGRLPSIIGSMKENTRAFYNNEVDVHISLNKVHRHNIWFDPENQQLKAGKDFSLKDHIQHYFDNGVFDCKRYTLDFLEAVDQVVNKIEVPDSPSVGGKMLPLTTSYEPCLRCMVTKDTGRPQARRCRHRPDCQPHKEGLPECLKGCADLCEFFSHERTCECQEYTTPSLTMTKIGVAIHVKFILEDGSFRHVDCDLNIPTVPVCTVYDGNIEEVGKYLLRTRPVGWLEEKGKLQDMGAAGGSPHLVNSENWQVKMRVVNRDVVLPRQVSYWFIQDELLISIFCRACSSLISSPCLERKATSTFS